MTQLAATTNDHTDDFVVWALYDCTDVVSLHTTEQGAHDARETHLAGLRPFITDDEDADLFRRVTSILPITVHTQ